VASTPPPNASSMPSILLDTKHYSAQGELILETGPNGRCRQVSYDAFDDLPIVTAGLRGSHFRRDRRGPGTHPGSGSRGRGCRGWRAGIVATS
jgi:hypothetical protein